MSKCGQEFDSVAVAAGQVAVVFDAAVAEEGPPAAHVLAVVKVEVYDDGFFLVVTRTVVELSLWTSHKTASPELYALGLA